MKMTLRVEGGERLARTLNELPTRVGKSVLREALRTASAPIVRARIEANAPIDPGAPDLRNQIVVSTGRARSGPEAAIVVGPSTAHRADQPKRRYDRQGIYLEFGTSEMPMQAFMRPAFDQSRAQMVVALSGALWRSLIARGFGSTRGAGGGGGTL